MLRLTKYLSAVCLLSVLPPASAAAASGSFSIGGPSGATASVDAGAGDGFWQRYRPLPMALELGAYGGVAHFADQHNLQNIQLVPDNPYGHQRLATALDLGLRAAFYPLAFTPV